MPKYLASHRCLTFQTFIATKLIEKKKNTKQWNYIRLIHSLTSTPRFYEDKCIKRYCIWSSSGSSLRLTMQRTFTHSTQWWEQAGSACNSWALWLREQILIHKKGEEKKTTLPCCWNCCCSVCVEDGGLFLKGCSLWAASYWNVFQGCSGRRFHLRLLSWPPPAVTSKSLGFILFVLKVEPFPTHLPQTVRHSQVQLVILF